MKTLLGVLLATSFICSAAAAQQKDDQRQPDRQIAPDLRAKIESMIKSESQQPVPTNDDKIEAVLVRKQRRFGGLFPNSIVMIEGAVYTSIGGALIPMPGGGASGCFDPTGVETAARVERARAEWSNQPKKD